MTNVILVMALVLFPVDIWNVYFGITKMHGLPKIIYLGFTGSAFIYHICVILYFFLKGVT